MIVSNDSEESHTQKEAVLRHIMTILTRRWISRLKQDVWRVKDTKTRVRKSAAWCIYSSGKKGGRRDMHDVSEHIRFTTAETSKDVVWKDSIFRIQKQTVTLIMISTFIFHWSLLSLVPSPSQIEIYRLKRDWRLRTCKIKSPRICWQIRIFHDT